MAASRRILRAGPLTVELDGVDLRRIRVGNREVVRRLFLAVRDEAWGTVPVQIRAVDVEEHALGFSVRIAATHEARGLRFHWRGELRGTEEGTIECGFQGQAETAFPFCRIGFCILHPREQAGCAYRASTPGGPVDGILPIVVGPQAVIDGTLHPLFPSYDALEIDIDRDLTARFDLAGDLFEMEDQRNWTDASLKTYSTPISLGFPRSAAAGDEFAQSVRLSIAAGPRDDDAVVVALGALRGSALPPVGLALPDGAEISESDVELLRALRLDHLRVDIDLGGDWQRQLAGAVALGRRLRAAFELVLRVGPASTFELGALAAALVGTEVARVLVLASGETVTDTGWVRAARRELADALPGVAFAGGTDLWFAQLNQERPDLEGLDGVFYSTAATIHAEDDVSVLETPAGLADTVSSARSLARGRSVFVGPVTLRPRTWPFGAASEAHEVDARQQTSLGAAWTVSVLARLADARPSAVTLFETSGPRGVLAAGTAFPLYHVLTAYGEWRADGELVESRVSHPLDVDVLAVQSRGALHALVANLTAEPRRCRLGPLPPGEAVDVRADAELRQPSACRVAPGGTVELALEPYGVARLDVVEGRVV